MPIKEIVDPKTGAVTWDWVEDGTAAAPPKQQAKPAARPKQDGNPVLDALGNVLRSTPIGMTADNLVITGQAVGAGINEFQRTGDLGSAYNAGSQEYIKQLQQPGRDIQRTIAGGGRDLLQNTSNLVQDVAAKVGVPGAVPTSPQRPDTNFLGVLPPLPQIPSSGPIENLGRGLVQLGLSIVPVNAGVGLVGTGLRMLPGGARLAAGAQGVRTAIAASKPAQAISKVPLLGPAAGAIAENVTTKNAVTGAILDMLISNPYEGRLYDHGERFYEQITGTPLQLPFEELLKADRSAIGLDARWGQALDGMGLGTGLSFIYRQGKLAAAALRLRAARQGADAGAAGALDVRKAQKDLKSAVEDFATDVVDQAEAAMPKPTIRELIQQRLDGLEQVRAELKDLPKVKRGTTGYKEYQAARKELLAQEKAINLEVQQLSVQELRERATVANAPVQAVGPEPQAIPVVPVGQAMEVPVARAAADLPLEQAPVAQVAPERPLVKAGAELSHGTTEAGRKGILADGFRASEYERSGTVAGEGVYMTPSERYAKEYGQKAVGGFLPEDAKILDWTGGNQTLADLADEIGIPGPRKLNKSAGEIELNQAQQQQLKQWALDNGYDGIQYRTNFTPGGKATEVVIYNTDLANRIVGSKAAPTPAAAAPEPSVPSAGTPVPVVDNAVDNAAPAVVNAAPAAGPSTQEIQELDELLARARADLPLEQRIALRDQQLAQKYGTGSPVEPVAVDAEAVPPTRSTPLADALEANLREMAQSDARVYRRIGESIDTQRQGLNQLEDPALPPAPPEPRAVPMPNAEWADRFVRSLDNIQQSLNDGTATIDDLIDNNILKIQSPSGNTQYVAAQPDLVEGYAAAMDAFTRDELGRPRKMDTQALKDWAVGWVEQNGFGDGREIQKMLGDLRAGLANADRNERALLLAAMETDTATKLAGLAGKRWLNARMDPTANVSGLAADLLSAASAQQGTITAFTSLTSRIGRLLRVLQIDRNLDVAGATAKRKTVAAMPAVDFADDFAKALNDHQQKSLAETLGKPISKELTEAIETGVYTPQSIAELDLLAWSLEQAAATPGYGKGFWDMMNKSVGIGARGLVMYRSAQLLSSGLTFWANMLNNTYRVMSLPLTQALGASVKGSAKLAIGNIDYATQDFARARDSLMMYGQYVSNLHNAFRLGLESWKVGRSLYDLDSSSVDFMDKLARRGSEMLSQPAGEWTLNTVPWVGVWDKTTWGRAQKAVWSALNLSTRTQVSADTFFKVLAGQSFEYARNLRPGLEAAVQMGMVPGSKEAWAFAKDYAQEMVDQQTRNIVVDGRTILDAVMESPNAQTAMRWATFTDDISAKMEKRTPTRGRELAIASGLKDEAAIEQYVQKYISDNSEDTPWFTGGPSFFPSTWQKLMDYNPVFTLIQPFNRTPGDIVKSTMRQSPLAPLVDTWWRDINSMDAMTRDRAVGDFTVGTAALGLAVMGLVGGKVRITGGAPVDPEARRNWYEIEKKQPFSISVLTGENELGQALWSDWVPLRMVEPIAGLLGAIGQFYELQSKLTLEQRERMAGSIVIDMMTQVVAGQYSKTYFQGLVDLFEAAQGIVSGDSGPNNRNPAMKLLAKIAASFTPGSSSLRAGRRIDDPTVRRPVASQAEGLEGDPTGVSKYAMRLFEETWQEMQNGIAGWSKDLPTEVSWITGTPMLLTGPVGAEHLPADQPWLSWLYQYNPLSPIQMGPANDDVVMMEMASLSGKGALFSGPRSTDFGRERRLNAWQMRDYKLAIATTPDETGMRLYDALEKEIRSERYQNLPREVPSSEVASYRALALNMIVERYREMGRDAFLRQYPDLKDDLDRVKERTRRKRQELQTGGTMIEGVNGFVETMN